MREPGWYWVKWFAQSRWQVAELNDEGEFENHVCFAGVEDVYLIGPKIEQPKEQSDE